MGQSISGIEFIGGQACSSPGGMPDIKSIVSGKEETPEDDRLHSLISTCQHHAGPGRGWLILLTERRKGRTDGRAGGPRIDERMDRAGKNELAESS